jgi:hypothetical protein
VEQNVFAAGPLPPAWHMVREARGWVLLRRD